MRGKGSKEDQLKKCIWTCCGKTKCFVGQNNILKKKLWEVEMKLGMEGQGRGGNML